MNNYKGQPSYINTILDAVQEEGAAAGFTVVAAAGTSEGGMHANATLLAAAVDAVKGADVVILALGLGNEVEGEGTDRSFLGTSAGT